MKIDAVTGRAWVEPDRIFKAFKYLVYALLTINVFIFLREDMLAARALFEGGVSRSDFIEAYSATIDTAAWVVLLLLFELETAVISDEKLKGGLKWLLLAVRLLCYLFIVSALVGYFYAWLGIGNTMPLIVQDVCSLLDKGFSHIAGFDEYPELDATSCASLQGQSLVQVAGTSIIGTAEAARAALGLALVDVINATDWLLIVVILEIEVLLQLRDRLSDRLMMMFKWVKGVLYAVLFIAAIYWGIEGDFVDFWDAFLWLVAFLFIELNIFQWHAEVEEEKAHGHGPIAGGS